MKQRQQMNLSSTSHWHLFKERTIELYIPPFAERRHLADLTRFTLPELWPADWTITQPLWWKWWEWPLALEVSIVSLLVIASRKKQKQTHVGAYMAWHSVIYMHLHRNMLMFGIIYSWQVSHILLLPISCRSRKDLKALPEPTRCCFHSV